MLRVVAAHGFWVALHFGSAGGLWGTLGLWRADGCLVAVRCDGRSLEFACVDGRDVDGFGDGA